MGVPPWDNTAALNSATPTKRCEKGRQGGTGGTGREGSPGAQRGGPGTLEGTWVSAQREGCQSRPCQHECPLVEGGKRAGRQSGRLRGLEAPQNRRARNQMVGGGIRSSPHLLLRHHV